MAAGKRHLPTVVSVTHTETVTITRVYVDKDDKSVLVVHIDKNWSSISDEMKTDLFAEAERQSKRFRSLEEEHGFSFIDPETESYL